MDIDNNYGNGFTLTLNRNDFPYLPLREAVYTVIKNAILENRIHLGQRFTEEKLAEQLGVSRTPLREALRKLEIEGYVNVYSGKYAEVATAIHEELHEEYELREVMEGFAARLASKYRTVEDISKMKLSMEKMKYGLDQKDVQTIVSANSDFHITLVSASQNRKLKDVMSSLWKSMLILSTSSLKNLEWGKEALKQHLEIFTAVETQNEKLAERLMQEHIRNAMLKLPESM